jgi:hypothetical protein
VSKDEDYRNNAFDTLKLAERASSLADKLRLLQLAEGWMNLADRAQGLTRRFRNPSAPPEVHPLIESTLKDPREEA